MMKTREFKIHHLNCGVLHAPPGPVGCCHCVLIERDNQLLLVDTGIGLLDIAAPEKRIGAEAIKTAGFQFYEPQTAVRQIEALGFCAADVSDIFITHCDPDHVGGLGDFPDAKVHLSRLEFEQIHTDNPRYRPQQFEHQPNWVTYQPNGDRWFGLDVMATHTELKAYLVWLPGHTLGHCGVAIQDVDSWILHVGDAYYLRAELFEEEHPVTYLAKLRAEDNEQRMNSLNALRRLQLEQRNMINMFGYHDREELPVQ